MTFRELLVHGERLLEQAEVPEAKLNTWYLLSYVTGWERKDFFLHEMDEAPENVFSDYEEVLKQRASRKPLEYITKETAFMGLPFFVNEKVLIPRQDTECLVEEVLPLVRGKKVLDLCTGSGCIGVSLAALGKCRTVTLADLSKEALAVAEQNAVKNGVDVCLVQGDLFENIEGKFDVIVSNPPYIPTGEVEKLMPEVRDYEPLQALDGDEDGLAFYRRIIEKSLRYLQSDGWLCFEIGCDQGEAVAAAMKEAGYGQIVVKKDLAGLERVVLGCRMEV